MNQNFEHIGKATLRIGFMVRRPSFGKRSHDIPIRQIKVTSTDVINISFIRQRKRKVEHYRIKRDWLSFAELLIDGESVWGSEDHFPVCVTLEELNIRYPIEDK